MNIRVVHSSFEISLIDTSFTRIEENNWYKEDLLSKYTYPIVMELPDDLLVKLKHIGQRGATGYLTIFDVIFILGDREHEAVMEIKKVKGRTIDFELRYGFEEFPNFNLKLSQLPLLKEELVGESIYEHAEDRVDLTYPVVDYNFPRIFNDEINTEDEQWAFFEGSMNLYQGGSFVVNEYDLATDTQKNYNIMQPLPHLLYVLKKGFEMGGFELKGDVLEDSRFQNAFLYRFSEYYGSITDSGSQEMVVKTDEFIAPYDGPFKRYQETIIIEDPGRYLVNGNLFLRALGTPFAPFAYAEIRLNGVRLWLWRSWESEKYYFVDGTFEVPVGESNMELTFNSINLNYGIQGGAVIEDATILDITVSQLVAFDINGDAIPRLIAPNVIDLTKCVPDVTFGDLVEFVRTLSNYRGTVDGTDVYLNKISDKVGQGEIFDGRFSEEEFPEITLNKGKSFELVYDNPSNEDFDYGGLLIDNTGVATKPYVTNRDTKQIRIPGVYLPNETRSGDRTALDIVNDKSRIQVVLYSGLIGGKNLTFEPMEYEIQKIFDDNYSTWLLFQIDANTYKWIFRSDSEQIKNLTTESNFFAYGKYHVVKKLSITKVGRFTMETEIETDSIE
ncbi:hypothetical protein [Altibacter sp. HG106]|uniref:hypothetical protein n=1 Tax=Altibacter sp. HG106 TaxID=3023937 RepID=UPI00235103BC|nr:hypothetical protein [Altibacter sp. HG106]MDC7994483.1 hypothetical protein [Altibacter sp. HG106]